VERFTVNQSAANQLGDATATQLIARLESVPITRWHVRCRIIMGSATFFDAFSALSLAFALPVLVGLWRISPQQSGYLISSAYLGQLIGALLFSWVAERFGRVRSATIAVAIMAAMGLACVAARDFSTLFTFRFIQGIGIGGEMPVAAAYISELAQARGRGRFFLLYEMIFPIGLMSAGQAGAWLVPAWGWQAIFLVGAIPSMVVAWLVARLPESPRWLISQGRLREAEAVIQKMEASAPLTDRRPSETPIPSRDREGALSQTRWSEVVSPFYRTRTLVVWTLWASAFFVANGLNNWLPSLYNTIYRLPLGESLRAASWTNVAQVLLLLVCALWIDRIGRRTWTAAAFLAGGSCLAILGISGAHNVTAVVILCTLSYGIIGSANAVLYLYTPEVYPTRMRVIGIGLATSWLRIASAVSPTVVGFMVVANGIRSVFLMFAAASIVGILAALRMIETRGQRLEEIAP
jgi:MFS transporter, putative metabolite:H+ symporter